jgi:hypothetical protein
MASARIALAIREVEAGEEVVMSSSGNESKKRGAGEKIRKLGRQSASARCGAQNCESGQDAEQPGNRTRLESGIF